MNVETVPEIHFVKWSYWKDNFGKVKTRPVLYISRNEQQVLCIPGSSKNQNHDFTLDLPSHDPDSTCKTYFAWENAVLCCKVCNSPKTPPLKVIDNQIELLDTKPNTYDEPSISDISCECQIILEEEHFWTTHSISYLLEDLENIPAEYVFTYQNQRCYVSCESFKHYCKHCKPRPETSFCPTRVELFIKNFSFKENTTAKMYCDCTFPRFSILRHRHTRKLSVVVSKSLRSQMLLANLTTDENGIPILFNSANNNSEKRFLKDKDKINYGHFYEVVGKLECSLSKAKLGLFWSGGDFQKLPVDWYW